MADVQPEECRPWVGKADDGSAVVYRVMTMHTADRTVMLYLPGERKEERA
jgi:hypothetical protein